MSLPNLLSNLFGNIPYFGKRMKVARLNSVLVEIKRIKNQFNKPMVRFDDNIHALYDCLQGLDLTLEEDIDWFHTLDITCYSKTSKDASMYLKRHFENSFPKEEHYFKNTSAGSLETYLFDWYSNYESTQDFIDKFLFVLDLYCTENPKIGQHEPHEVDEQDVVYEDSVYTDKRVKELNPSLMEFFIQQPFRLLLEDFMVTLELVIYSQLRRLNGQTI